MNTSVPLEIVDETVFPLNSETCVPLCDIVAPEVDRPLSAQYCNVSNIAFVSPRPTADFYQQFYGGGFHKDIEERTEFVTKKSKFRFQLICETLERYGIELPESPDTFDLGCGTGIFASVFRERFGGRTFGVEPDQSVADGARKTGTTIVGQYIDDVLAEQKQYQIVTMIHVLEHMQHPMRELDKIKRVMTPDGLLIIQVPDLDAAISLNLAHIFQYTPRALSLLLQNQGFKVVAGMSSQWPKTTGHPMHRKNITVVAAHADSGLAAIDTPAAKPVGQILAQHTHWASFGQRSLLRRGIDRVRSALSAN